MNQALFEKVKETYGIPGIVTFEKVQKGFLSENYKISAEGQNYFLKKYRFEDEEKIKEIHSVKSYFSEGGIPVIMPIRTADDKTFFEHEKSFLALFPFVSGLQPERGNLTDKMISSLGAMLGRIHLLGKGSPIKTMDAFAGWNKESALQTVKALEDRIRQIEKKNEFDMLAQQVIALKKELINKNAVNLSDLSLRNDHLVHGDYLDQNVFFDENGEVKHVFDFEKTQTEPRTQELFRAATYSFLNTDFDGTSIKNMRLFIKSYLDVYPMDERELKDGLMAHYVKTMHGFWVEKEHYLKNNNRVDQFLELNFKRLKFTSERLGDFLE